ncbi:MAG: asparaginase [Bacteroidetes bacterium]|nr:asparaginase [Bacteroidota bacterium]
MGRQPRKKVYVLYTGGTIGMAGSPLKPLSPEKFAALVASQPGFSQDTLTVQLEEDKPTVIDYTLKSFKTPLDSSSMTPEDWVTIAEDLLDNYEGFDGLVVLHGTDTMAFTASALSFLMEGLDKPVVVTGSQVPLQQTRNDALRNMVSAITVAATSKVPESTLLFDTKLIRGNRSEKVNASFFPAFESPNFTPLGKLGIDIHIDDSIIQPLPPAGKRLSNEQNRKKLSSSLKEWSLKYKKFSVISLILFPGIQASMVKAIIEETKPEIKGAIIMAFGSGNAPANQELLDYLKVAHERGIVLVDITQVMMGSVNLDAYQSASGLKEAGAVSGYDMTPEAALTKLIWLTGQGHSQKEIERELTTDLHGEITREIAEKVDAFWDRIASKKIKAG